MELLQQLDAIFTVQRGLVFAVVLVCVVCIIQLFLDKQRKNDDVIVQLDITGKYWHVKANCRCCGKTMTWTTDDKGAEDVLWIKDMTTTYCCYEDSIEDGNTEVSV